MEQNLINAANSLLNNYCFEDGNFFLFDEKGKKTQIPAKKQEEIFALSEIYTQRDINNAEKWIAMMDALDDVFEDLKNSTQDEIKEKTKKAIQKYQDKKIKA